MSDDESADGGSWDRLGSEDKVTDSEWESVMAGFNDFDAVNSEVSADETADYLAEQESWSAPPAPPIGIRRARPGFVLAVAGLLIGIAGLVLGAMFFRGMPALLTAFFVASGAGGAIALLFFLPKNRENHFEDGAEV